MMKSILKPSVLGGFFLLLILMVQGTYCRSESMTFHLQDDKYAESQSAYGVGKPITVTTAKGTTVRDINWAILLLNLAFSYLLASVLASFFLRTSRFRRLAWAYAITALVMVVISFFSSVGISRLYWGYYFTRPPVLNEVHDIASVSAVVPVTTTVHDTGAREIIANDDFSITERVAYGRKDYYYCLDERLLLALDDMDLLPHNHSTELQLFPALYPLVQKTGILAEPREEYDDSDLLQGIVIDTLSKSGQRMVFVALTGRQLSNDHYPYYEMVFTGNPDSSSLTYTQGQRFFYDVAGMEGFEWYGLWLLLTWVGVVFSFVAVTVLMLIWMLVRSQKKASHGESSGPPEPALDTEASAQ